MSIHINQMSNSCKIPLKTHVESPRVIHRGNKRNQYNPAHRKSAVERLEESKANYVKSECVLDSKQEFAHSSHLQVSKAPHVDVLLSAPAKHAFETHVTSPPKYSSQGLTPVHDYDYKQPYLSSIPAGRTHLNLPSSNQLSKSPASDPSNKPVRRRARSQSEIKDSQNRPRVNLFRRSSSRSIEGPTNLEIRLKQLISSSSKENILSGSETRHNSIPHIGNGANLECQEGLQIKRNSTITETSNHDFKKASPKTRSRQASQAHKSLPDLSPVRVFPLRRRLPVSSSSSSEDSYRLRRTRPRSETFINEIRSLRSTRSKSQVRICDAKSTENLRQSLSKIELSRSQTLKYNGDSYKRRPVFRSKSDITYVKQKEILRRRNSATEESLQDFFDMLGLEQSLWYHVTSPETPTSPPRYFDSSTSIDSVEYRSSFCSDNSSLENPHETNGDGGGAFKHSARPLRPRIPVETSIVEKNARVIKWLYHCRKAHVLGS